MIASQIDRLKRFNRIAGLSGAAALFVSAILAWMAPSAAAPAWRFAAFACLQPALGSLIFAFIYRTTGGQWGGSLAEFLSAGIRLIPWIWPLIALLLLVPSSRPTSAHAALAPGVLALAIRAAAYEIVFIFLGKLAVEEWGRSYSGPGLIVLIFTLHFLAADWFFTLDPGWYSTGFPLIWMSIQAASGLALAIGIAALCGRDPGARGPAGRPVGRDWGDLILTTVIFSSYLAFVQLLIIWSGNLPREISWYLRRSSSGWTALVICLALFHLAFPVAFMLSRRLKSSRWGVPAVAWLLSAVELLWAAWFILPPFADRGALFPVLCATCLLAGAGLFINRYLTTALQVAAVAGSKGAP